MRSNSLVTALVGSVFIVSAWAAAGPAAPTLSIAQLRALYGDAAGRYATIGGIEVYYKDEGSGPAVLLVHGSAMSLKTYDEVAAILRKRHRVIRYDVPGQGLSGPVSDAAAAALQPADVAAGLLAKLGIPRVTAVGVSSGGTLCVYLAAQHPDLVERLVLANTPADPVETSQLREPQEFLDAQREARETHFQSRHFWELFLAYFSGVPVRMTPAIITQFYDFNRRMPEKNALSLVAKVADHARAIDAMSRVSVPVLLVWGARDPLLPPPAADVLGGYLTHAAVSKLLLPDVGHYPNLEVPQRFAAIVATYIDAVAVSTAH